MTEYTSVKMKLRDLSRTYGEPISLPKLKDGMCVVLYTDKGPAGLCGQSMHITCPHASILIFPDYATMKAEMDASPFRRGQQTDVRWFEVGSGGTGVLSIGVHDCSPGKICPDTES